METWSFASWQGARNRYLFLLLSIWAATTQAAPPFQLRIESATTNEFALTWTNAPGQFLLESTASLSPPILWSGVESALQRQGELVTVPLSRGATQQFFRLRWVSVNTAPPDPVTIAPVLDMSQVSEVASATAFLYSGPTPIQTGLVAGAIQAVRAAVIRGRVRQSDGAPLADVAIMVLNRPEFGRTRSRLNGEFDLAVNGGSTLTISCEKEGYFPVHRQATVPMQDYVALPGLVMTPQDSQMTVVQMGSTAAVQVARASLQSDRDGQRRATLLFMAGTRAGLIMPNGTTNPATSLQVRATEFTVGPNGPAAMPAPLPPASGYTYCVDLSADEAKTAGAVRVQFDRPVILCVDNFLQFPIGTLVPMGSYDQQRCLWMPSESGRVIKVLSITGGLANLDLAGSNTVASSSALAALGITEAERRQLAQLYAAGSSFWRTPVTHFSPWDKNWGFGPPPDAKPPSWHFPAPPDPKPKAPSCRDGSVIEVQTQTLGESVEIAGTSFQLNYQSDRVPGRKVAFTLPVELSGASVPASLKRIDLEVAVAGRRFTQSFPPGSNQTTSFTWDGRDAYGRVVPGRQSVRAILAYVYDGVYQQTPRFGYNGNGLAISGNIARREVFFPQEFRTTIGLLDSRAAGLGGWNLSVHHAYDPVAKTVHLGSGERLDASQIPPVISRYAGRGNCPQPSCGDGGHATQARFDNSRGLAVDAQGNVYVAEHARVRKIDATTGIITAVAGNGAAGFSGDGGPATNAMLNFGLISRGRLALDGVGNLYIADDNNYRVRKVDALTGIITTVAGSGVFDSACRNDPASVGPSCGDGGPATAAKLEPAGIAVDDYGNLYIGGQNRIRKVDPAGVISTVVFGAFTELPAVDRHGNVYFVDAFGARVQRLNVDGSITGIAGTNGILGFAGDGGPAVDARLNTIRDISLDAQGNLYIAARENHRIRVVTTDGFINTLAGTGGRTLLAGTGGPATAADINAPTGARPDTRGNLFILEDQVELVHKVSAAFPGFDATGIAIASEDGSEVYVFNSIGRHLRTLQALTGATLYEFTYDAAGRLLQVTDGDNNVTTVERNASGAPTAIVSPYGQRTSLAVDANGFLSRIADPLANAHQFTYTSDGLLTRMMTPEGHAYQFAYDSLGRLVRDSDPADGFQALARSESGNDYTVTLSTAMNRTNTYQVETLSTGDERRTNTDPAGLQTRILRKMDGTNITMSSDGTIETLVETGDPRFGLQAPLVKAHTLTTPGGRNFSSNVARSVVLTNPVNPLSVDSLTDTITINGRGYTNSYSASNRTFTLSTPAGRRVATTIDAFGRVRQRQVAGLSPSAYTYDARGRVSSLTTGTGVEARTFSYAYNSAGYLASITDPLGRIETFTYDAAGRVTQQTLPGNRTVNFGYDPEGNIASITPPGRSAHLFTYTPVELTSSYVPPSLAGGSNQTAYAYNLDRQLVRVTRPDGQIIEFNHDAAGRLASRGTSSGVSFYNYNPTTGNRSAITALNGPTLALAYDGALVTGRTWSGLGSVSQTYDDDFRRASENVNGTQTINFTYDRDGLLTGAGALTLTRHPQHGLVTATLLGNVNDTRSYNSFGELTAYTASFNATALLQMQYSFDALGRITRKIETVGGATDTYDYGYDADGRLATVQKNGALLASYTYDANGNRLNRTTPGGSVTGTYDDQDRLTQYGANTYAYSANGELERKVSGGQTTTYQYDVLGNLTRATLPNGRRIDYEVDGEGRRIGRSINGTREQGFLYSSGVGPVAELDASGGVAARFIFGSKGHVPDYMIRGGVTYRIVTDHLGSVRLVVNTTSGAIAQRMDYDEFGNVTLDTNPGLQPFGFAGGLYDRETGWVRFGARDYDPQTGRWTMKDPILFPNGETNPYTYALNDPINLLDPDGLFCIRIKIKFKFHIGKGNIQIGAGIGARVEIGPIRAQGGVGGGLSYSTTSGSYDSSGGGYTRSSFSAGAGVGGSVDVGGAFGAGDQAGFGFSSSSSYENLPPPDAQGHITFGSF